MTIFGITHMMHLIWVDTHSSDAILDVIYSHEWDEKKCSDSNLLNFKQS